MSKFSLNFENIPRGIVSKKHSNILNPSIPIKPQLEWLRNYLRPSAAQSQKETEVLRPNMSKKSTIRRLLKTKNKIVGNNENKNCLNDPRFGILSNKTLVKKIEESDLLDPFNEGHQRRNSCQLFRNTKKQGRPSFSRGIKSRGNKEKALAATLEPWEIEDIKSESIDPDIVGYMFTRLH